MKPGPKPKPLHLKLLGGNAGHRPLNRGEPRPARAMPEPPDFLSDDALAEWHRVAPELHRLGLLTVLDRTVLAAYCASVSLWRLADGLIARHAESDPPSHGLVVETQRGRTAQSPFVSIARAAMADAVRFGSEFGLTPSSRSRLTGTPAPEPSAYAEFGRPPSFRPE